MSVTLAGTDEVLSGEAVAIDVQPVGLFLRAVGALIDVIVSVVLFLMLLLLVSRLAYEGMLSELAMRIAVVVLIVLTMVVVPLTVEVATRGRSLGRLAIGGRIVRTDSGTAGFRHAFIRTILGVLEIYLSLGSIALITATFSARSQRLGDMVAGTYCQRVRTPPLITHAPVMPPALYDWAQLADVARLPDRLARRISQFLQHAELMTPAARVRIAADLVEESREFVSPQPSAPPEQILQAMTTVRRQREYRSLALAEQRVQKLLGRAG